MKWDTNKTNLNNAYIVTVWETSHGWKYANYSAQCLIKNHTFEEETGCRGNSIDPRIRYTAFSQVISWLQCRVAIANGDPEVFCQRHIGCIIQDTQAGEELHLLVQCDRALKRWRKHNEQQYLHNAQAMAKPTMPPPTIATLSTSGAAFTPPTSWMRPYTGFIKRNQCWHPR
jgi:hypothetical protein